jgi:hypothetical protein
MELAKPYAVFLDESSTILGAFLAVCGAPPHFSCVPGHELSCEGAVEKLQDRWSHFCREVVLLSACGLIRTTSGVVLPRGIRGREAALIELRQTFTGRSSKGRFWEPKWFDASEAIDSALRLSIPNFSNVSAALGSTPSPLEEIRAVRNFFAHRGTLAAKTLRSLTGVSSTPEIHAFLRSTSLGGMMQFELWTRQLQRIARAAVV